MPKDQAGEFLRGHRAAARRKLTLCRSRFRLCASSTSLGRYGDRSDERRRKLQSSRVAAWLLLVYVLLGLQLSHQTIQVALLIVRSSCHR